VQAAARDRVRAMVHPALNVWAELLDAKEFPTVRFATSREIINRELGKPGESVDVTVNVSLDQLTTAINHWKAKRAE
jgi:hypothetical protein